MAEAKKDDKERGSAVYTGRPLSRLRYRFLDQQHTGGGMFVGLGAGFALFAMVYVFRKPQA